MTTCGVIALFGVPILATTMAKSRSIDAATSTADEVEGLGDEHDQGLGDYPIDTLSIRTETRTVFDVLRRIERGEVIMNPEFQRDFVWDREKQGRLIESIVMRIPLPVFYFAENKRGQIIVVDGLQRLSTLRAFCHENEKLQLSDQPTLDNRTFAELPRKLQNRIEDCQLQLYIIDSKVPERAKLDIFERVNNGVPLTRQQMRNCLYTGPATNFLKVQAETPLFDDATGSSLSRAKMRDREFVNRFCAFQLLPIDSYTKDIDAFLASGLERMNSLPVSELAKLESDLHTALNNNLRLFGKHAFRKHAPGQSNRGIINAALWDVMTTGLSRYPTPHVDRHLDSLRAATYALLRDSDFNLAISYSTNGTKSVRTRFELSRLAFQEVLGALPD